MRRNSDHSLFIRLIFYVDNDDSHSGNIVGPRRKPKKHKHTHSNPTRSVFFYYSLTSLASSRRDTYIFFWFDSIWFHVLVLIFGFFLCFSGFLIVFVSVSVIVCIMYYEPYKFQKVIHNDYYYFSAIFSHCFFSTSFSSSSTLYEW